MNQAETSALQLEKLLREQLRHIELLTAYLDDVRAAIRDNASQELERLLQSGCPSLAMLDSLQQSQNNLLRAQGYSAGAPGLQQYLAQLDQPGLKTLGQSLAQKLEQLQKSLLINDLLVRKNQDRVRQSIRILSGRTNQPSQGTYSSRGQANNTDADQRHLATA